MGRPRIVYSPELLVVADRLKPDFSLKTDTVEFATGFPLSSLATPRTAELVSCAFPATGTTSIITATKAASTDPVNRDLFFILNPHLKKYAKFWSTNEATVFRVLIYCARISQKSRDTGLFVCVRPANLTQRKCLRNKALQADCRQ
jgi:hypothetical protein